MTCPLAYRLGGPLAVGSAGFYSRSLLVGDAGAFTQTWLREERLNPQPSQIVGSYLWTTLTKFTGTIRYELLLGVPQTRLPRYEQLQGLAPAAALAWEAAQLLPVTAVAPWEAEQRVAQSDVETWEALAGIVQTRPPRYEQLVRLAPTVLPPWEAEQRITQVDVEAWEALLGIRQSDIEAWEALQGVVQTRAPRYEQLVRLAPTVLPFWEAEQFLATLAVDPWEAEQGFSASAASTWEALMGVVQSRSPRYEQLVRLAPTLVAPWEALAYIAQTGVVPWEAEQYLAPTVAAVWEALMGVVQVRSPRYEQLVLLKPSAIAAWEAEQGISATSVAAWEALLGLAPTVIAAWEALQGVVQTRSPRYEQSVLVAPTSVAAWEALQGILASAASTWEAEQGLFPSAAVAWEVLQSVIQTRSPRYEQIVKLLTSTVPAWEALLGIAASSGATWEAEQGLFPTAAPNWEALTRVLQTRSPRYEQLARILASGSSSWEALLFATALATAVWESRDSWAGGLPGVVVTNLQAQGIGIPPWVAGLVEEVDPKILAPGTISDGENMVPQRVPRLATRGGTRILLTLHDDAGGAELSHVVGAATKAATGVVVIGWSSGTTKHYAYALTSDIAFAGANEAASRTPLPATWNRATVGRPVSAVLFEKVYVCDANPVYASRNTFLGIDAAIPPAINEPTFVLAGGAAAALRPYCLEEYNNVLFIAGYGDEGAGDDVSLVRHSYLGVAPDGATGFDKDAYNTIGAKGDRVTAMRKGRGLLLVAKANELHRISGFGKAYPGWQYQVEGVQNTKGFGVENPLAFEHAGGFWFGIGKEGPFRTDGFDVDSLVGPRQRTWRGIDQLASAFVRFHPERNVVLFGVHVAAGAPDATYPYVLMVWDLERSVWQPNWKFAGSTRYFVVGAVETTTLAGPSNPPNTLAASAVGPAGYTAGWVNGDATCETEVWDQDVTNAGAMVLKAVAAAGVLSQALTGMVGRTNHSFKMRHRKNGVYSGFTAVVSVDLAIDPPALSIVVEYGTGRLFVLAVSGNNAVFYEGCELYFSPDGIVAYTLSNADFALYSGQLLPSGYYKARFVDAAWSRSPSAYSNIVTVP